MKNYMLALGVMLGLSAFAQANSQVRPQAVTSVIGSASSSFTVTGLSISSAPATSIVVDTAQQYKQVCAQNLDTTSALYCGETINVSSYTTTAGALALHGVVVPPATSATAPSSPVCFAIVAGTNFYCRTGKVTAATNAVIIRAR